MQHYDSHNFTYDSHKILTAKLEIRIIWLFHTFYIRSFIVSTLCIVFSILKIHTYTNINVMIPLQICSWIVTLVFFFDKTIVQNFNNNFKACSVVLNLHTCIATITIFLFINKFLWPLQETICLWIMLLKSYAFYIYKNKSSLTAIELVIFANKRGYLIASSLNMHLILTPFCIV